MFPEGSKPNLKAHLEAMRLLIDVNNSELSVYTNYLIAAFAVFTPLYFTLWGLGLSWIYSIVLFAINMSVVFIFINKIKDVKDCNSHLIEGYNVIQSQRGGSILFKARIDKDKIKEFEEISKQHGIKFSPYDPFNKEEKEN